MFVVNEDCSHLQNASQRPHTSMILPKHPRNQKVCQLVVVLIHIQIILLSTYFCTFIQINQWFFLLKGPPHMVNYFHFLTHQLNSMGTNARNWSSLAQDGLDTVFSRTSTNGYTMWLLLVRAIISCSHRSWTVPLSERWNSVVSLNRFEIHSSGTTTISSCLLLLRWMLIRTGCYVEQIFLTTTLTLTTMEKFVICLFLFVFAFWEKSFFNSD